MNFLCYQGQYCDICTSEDTNRAHPINNAIDGTERWWQSPPLSRSTKYNEVNVTLDLGQVCYWCIPYICQLSITPPPTRTYRVQIIQRTVESSDTRLQQALLWIAHECRISRVDPKLSLIHSYSSLEYLEVFFFALNTSHLGLVYRRLLFVNSRTARGHLRLLLSKLSWSINITHALPQHSQWLLHKQSALLHIAYMLPKWEREEGKQFTAN